GRASRLPRRQTVDRRLEMAPPDHVLDEPERHPDTGARKPNVPIDAFRKPARDDGAEKRAEVDTHVKQGESGVAPLVTLLVEPAHQRADVWLEHSRPDHDQREARIQERQAGERQREMAERDDDAADEHAAVLAEPRVGDQSAEDRREPDAGDVRRVGRAGVGIGEGQRLRQVQDQEAAHPVVAEALPHLGEEERSEAARVTEETRFAVHRSNRSSCAAVSGCVVGRSRLPSLASHFSTSKWCSFCSARRSTGENSWNASSSSRVAWRSASCWKLSSLAPMSSRIACSVRDATIGSACPSMNTLVRWPGPLPCSIGVRPRMRSERQYLP